MLKHYPWTEIEKGQGFFVPALDLAAEREAGLRAAVKVRVLDARATYCLRDGLIGVLFHRAPPAPKKPRGSSAAASHPESPASPSDPCQSPGSGAQPG